MSLESDSLDHDGTFFFWDKQHEFANPKSILCRFEIESVTVYTNFCPFWVLGGFVHVWLFRNDKRSASPPPLQDASSMQGWEMSYVSPRFLDTDVGWNLGLTQKRPTLPPCIHRATIPECWRIWFVLLPLTCCILTGRLTAFKVRRSAGLTVTGESEWERGRARFQTAPRRAQPLASRHHLHGHGVIQRLRSPRNYQTTCVCSPVDIAKLPSIARVSFKANIHTVFWSVHVK